MSDGDAFVSPLIWVASLLVMGIDGYMGNALHLQLVCLGDLDKQKGLYDPIVGFGLIIAMLAEESMAA